MLGGRNGGLALRAGHWAWYGVGERGLTVRTDDSLLTSFQSTRWLARFLCPSIFFLSQHTCLFRHTQVLAPPWQPASTTSCLKGRQHPNWCSSRCASLSSIKHIQRDGRKWQSWKTIKQGGLGSSLRGNNIELLSEESTDRSQTSPKGLMTRIGVSLALMAQTCSRYMCIHLCQTNE